MLRAIPLLVYLLVALGAINLIANRGGVSGNGTQRLVFGFAVYGFFIQTAVILVVFFSGRSDMDKLERQLEKMEKLASCNSPTMHRQILTRVVLFVTLDAVSCGLWVSFPLVVGDFTHGNYQIQMELPQALQTQLWYWYCLAFQIVAVVLSCWLALAFDCCLFTWLNAVSFHLTAIRNRVHDLDSQPSPRRAPQDEEAPPSPMVDKEPAKKAWSIDCIRGNEDEKPPRSSPISENNIPPVDYERLFIGNVTTEDGTELDASEPIDALHIIDMHYSQVTTLSEIINHLCGPAGPRHSRRDHDYGAVRGVRQHRARLDG